MSIPSAPLRPLIAAAIGLASILAGAALAFRLVTPGHVRGLHTIELLGLLGLLLLPCAALAVLLVDRHARRHTPPVATEALDNTAVTQ